MATADQLLSRVKVRLGWSDAQAFLSDPEILELFDSEIRDTLWPQLLSAQGDWHLSDQDYTLDGSRALHRLPANMWGPVKDVGFIIDGRYVAAGITTVEEIGHLGKDTRPTDGRVPGFAYVKGDSIGVHPSTAVGTMRVIYYRQPNQLTLLANAAKIAAIPIPLGADNTFLIDTAHTDFDQEDVDIIAAGGAHQFVSRLFVSGVSLGGAGMTVFAGIPANTLALDDYVALKGFTPVAQIPDHMEAQLLQRVKMLCADSNGDEKAFARSALLAGEQERRVLPTIDPRVEAEPQIIRPRRGMYR